MHLCHACVQLQQEILAYILERGAGFDAADLIFFFVAALVLVFDFGMGLVTLMCTDYESVLLLRTCLPLCPL